MDDLIIEPKYCSVHQHYKWCDHNGGVPTSDGYGPPDPPRLQIVPFGVWTKLAHWDGFARSWRAPHAVAELRPDGSLMFDGPVELRRELPEVDHP